VLTLLCVDGLYVFLHPQKNKPGLRDKPKAPEHLSHLVSPKPGSEFCRWQLSGPQFEKDRPSALQQRYCYPQPLKNNSNVNKEAVEEYIKQKGSSLWTIHDENGVESKTYRFFHVYHSSKRASNRRSAKASRKKPKTTPSIMGFVPCCTPTRRVASSGHRKVSPDVTTRFAKVKLQPSSPLIQTEIAKCSSIDSNEMKEPQFHFVSPRSCVTLHQEDSIFRSREYSDSPDLQRPSYLFEMPHDDLGSFSYDDAEEQRDHRALDGHVFAEKLKTVRNSLRDTIVAAPEEDRDALVAELRSWAQQLSKDALSTHILQENPFLPSPDHLFPDIVTEQV